MLDQLLYLVTFDLVAGSAIPQHFAGSHVCRHAATCPANTQTTKLVSRFKPDHAKQSTYAFDKRKTTVFENHMPTSELLKIGQYDTSQHGPKCRLGLFGCKQNEQVGLSDYVHTAKHEDSHSARTRMASVSTRMQTVQVTKSTA